MYETRWTRPCAGSSSHSTPMVLGDNTCLRGRRLRGPCSLCYTTIDPSDPFLTSHCAGLPSIWLPTHFLPTTAIPSCGYLRHCTHHHGWSKVLSLPLWVCTMTPLEISDDP